MYWEWSLACTNLKLCIRIFLEDCQLAWEKIVLGYMLAMQKYKLSHLPVLRNIPWHFKLNNIDKIHKHTHTSLVTFASANAKWKKKMQKCKKQVAFFTPEDTNSSFIQTNSLQLKDSVCLFSLDWFSPAFVFLLSFSCSPRSQPLCWWQPVWSCGCRGNGAELCLLRGWPNLIKLPPQT